jgi:endonuclease/exonuclease/phosphatase family metal-dependent hydrolase
MRLATFNVENLFTRFLFARGVDRREASQTGFTADDLRFRLADPVGKRLTANVMNTVNADVFALQEVEGLDVLKHFRDRYLGGPERWPHALVIDGNDPRRIDVGVLSRYPITHARSWQHLRANGDYIFDRDCLEADVATPLGPLTLYVNHFKSMRAPDGAQGSGRALTRARRVLQSQTVKDIVRERFGDDPSDGAFVVLGDFNDYLADDRQGRSAIRGLVEWEAVENVLDRRPEDDRWTHFFRGHRGRGPAYNQLDFLLPSKRLADANPATPGVSRIGMPHRAERFAGERLEGVGRNRPKASDHCPLYFDFERL